MKILVPLVSGFVFGVGLLVSGMANPAKVVGFLDVGGAWDPSLAFVMLGALLVAVPGYRWARRRRCSLLGDKLHMPLNTTIDRQLLLGSAIFGVGWGMTGICPGPGLLLLGLGAWEGVLFVLAMLLGMAVFKRKP